MSALHVTEPCEMACPPSQGQWVLGLRYPDPESSPCPSPPSPACTFLGADLLIDCGPQGRTPSPLLRGRKPPGAWATPPWGPWGLVAATEDSKDWGGVSELCPATYVAVVDRVPGKAWRPWWPWRPWEARWTL